MAAALAHPPAPQPLKSLLSLPPSLPRPRHGRREASVLGPWIQEEGKQQEGMEGEKEQQQQQQQQ